MSKGIAFRAPAEADYSALLALNDLHAAELGALTAAAFSHLVSISFRTRMTDAADAFLIALEEGADYASPNYRWFCERFHRFAYVDRVVVAASVRKKGLARALYDDLIAAAIAGGHDMLACEVNFEPPNPASDAFHAALGFEEIGRAYLPDRGKSVRYLIKHLRRG